MHNMYHGFHLSTHFLKIEEIVQCIGNFVKEDNEKNPINRLSWKKQQLLLLCSGKLH